MVQPDDERNGVGIMSARLEDAARHLDDRLGKSDRFDRVRQRELGARPGRQPRILWATGENEDWRGLVDLVLHLPGDAEASGGDGLAVEDHQVDAARVKVLEHDGLGGALDVFKARKVRVRVSTERRQDGGSHISVVTVKQDT